MVKSIQHNSNHKASQEPSSKSVAVKIEYERKYWGIIILRNRMEYSMVLLSRTEQFVTIINTAEESFFFDVGLFPLLSYPPFMNDKCD